MLWWTVSSNLQVQITNVVFSRIHLKCLKIILNSLNRVVIPFMGRQILVSRNYASWCWTGYRTGYLCLLKISCCSGEHNQVFQTTKTKSEYFLLIWYMMLIYEREWLKAIFSSTCKLTQISINRISTPCVHKYFYLKLYQRNGSFRTKK